jgi:hypothetical protein
MSHDNDVAMCWPRIFIIVLVTVTMPAMTVSADLPAFPGAVGQGASAAGGRGGDVYHVTNLLDYDSDSDSKIEGSLRHAIRSATGPRTIVFDVGGAIKLRTPLEIRKNKLTIAGQTAPGGVTLWGYPVEISQASDVIARYLRVRTGDFNVRGSGAEGGSNSGAKPEGANDLDPRSANGLDIGRANRVIVDHVSVAWGLDETLSVTRSRDVTIQNSIIAESLNESFHPKGSHGYGTLARGELTAADQEAGTGGYTFYQNLWAHHRARNPSIGGQQQLDDGQAETDRRRADVNLINNVIYNWADQPTHRSELGEVRVNLVGNYFVNGPAKKSDYIFNEDNPARTVMYHRDNMLDADQDREHDGVNVGRVNDVRRTFRRFDSQDLLTGPTHGEPLNFFAGAAEHVVSPEDAYAGVVAAAGASLSRDAIDNRVIESLVERTGGLIDSQEIHRDARGVLAGIDDLPTNHRSEDFDTDRDGMPNDFEVKHGLNPDDPADGNGTQLSEIGYTNLEVYLSELTSSAASR